MTSLSECIGVFVFLSRKSISHSGKRCTSLHLRWLKKKKKKTFFSEKKEDQKKMIKEEEAFDEEKLLSLLLILRSLVPVSLSLRV